MDGLHSQNGWRSFEVVCTVCVGQGKKLKKKKKKGERDGMG